MAGSFGNHCCHKVAAGIGVVVEHVVVVAVCIAVEGGYKLVVDGLADGRAVVELVGLESSAVAGHLKVGSPLGEYLYQIHPHAVLLLRPWLLGLGFSLVSEVFESPSLTPDYKATNPLLFRFS